MPEFAFCMAVLAGIGLQNIFNLTPKRIIAQFVGICVGISIFFLANYKIALNSNWSINVFSESLNAYNWMILNISIAILSLICVLIWYLMGFKKWVGKRHLIYIIIIILIIELFIFSPHIRAERYPPYTQPPYIDFLKGDSSEYRVVGLECILYPNTATVYEIADIRDLSGLYINRYMTFIKRNLDPSAIDRFDGCTLKITPNRLKYLSLLNVKYILTPTYVINPILLQQDNSNISQNKSEKEFFEDPNNSFELVYNKEIKIFKNNDVIPRAFFVNQSIVLESENQILDKMHDEKLDLRKTVILEKEIPELSTLNVSLTFNTYFKPNVTISQYSPNYVKIRSQTDYPGFLVLTDSYYPGWNVYVDGKEKEILVADFLFRAVYLDKGTHFVEFKYKPISYTLGSWISILTALSILLFYLYKFRGEKNK
jgi:hypothetical protein